MIVFVECVENAVSAGNALVSIECLSVLNITRWLPFAPQYIHLRLLISKNLQKSQVKNDCSCLFCFK